MGSLSAETTIVLFTYRQSLALDLFGSKLKEHGFVNYMNENELYDRTKFKRIIIQIDSMDKLAEFTEDIPHFDYIIIDEMESALLHLSAKTLKRPVFAVMKLMFMMQGTEHKKPKIITLDALWSQHAYEFFKILGIKQEIIVNTSLPKQQKHFVYVRCDLAWWVDEISEKLNAGKNCVLQTLSYDHGEKVSRMLIESGVLVESQIVYHHARSPDSLKQNLQDVNTYWPQFRMLIYTGTIEAVKSRFSELYQDPKNTVYS